MQATNSVAGSSFLRTRSGKIQITAPNGEVVYHGPPTAEEIQNALAGEDEQIQAAVDAWLRRAGVFDSRWHSMPTLSSQMAPKYEPASGLRI